MNNRFIQTSSTLLLAAVLTACGGDDSSSSSTTSCTVESNGNSSRCDGSVSGSQVLSVQQLLNPGASLVLKHPLSSPSALVQFVHNGSLYDASDFPSFYAAENFDSNTYLSYQQAAADNDSYLMDNTAQVYRNDNGYEVLLAYYDRTTSTPYVQTVQLDDQGNLGNYVTLFSEDNADDAIRMQKMTSGNYWIHSVNGSDVAQLRIVDGAGVTQAGPVATGSSNPNAYSELTMVTELAGGKLGYCQRETTATADPERFDSAINLVVLDDTLTEERRVNVVTGVVAGANDVLKCHVQVLPSGRIVVLHEMPDANFNRETHVALLDADLNRLATRALHDSYLQQIHISEAGNGNVLIAFEIGGPDAAAYAVLNAEGAFVKTTQVLGNLEPEDFATFGYGDGSFSLVYSEDDSIATAMLSIDAEGNQLPGVDYLSPFYTVGYGKMQTAEAASGDGFVLLYEGYENPLALIEVSRNRLVVSQTGESEVTLTNHSQHDVEARLSLVAE